MKKSFGTAVRAAAVAGVAALGAGVLVPMATADPAPAPAPAPAVAPAATPHDPAAIGQLQQNLDAQGVAVQAPMLNLPEGFGQGVSTPKQIVAFGDSFTANAGKSGPRGLEPGQTPLVANCATDMENWPKIVGRDSGKSVGDWSCNGMGGAPIVQMLGYLEAAIMYGDLGPGTEEVVLMYGGMDTVQWVDMASQFANIPVPDESVYRQLIRHVKNRVNEVAPGARVTFTSYQAYAEPSSEGNGENLCLVNMPNNGIVRIPTPGSDKVQEAFRDNLRNAAHAAGANFIDVYEPTKSHSSCAPEDQRWVAGFMDPKMGPMTNHPTIQGQYGLAGIIKGGLGI
ncbi:GDSL-type esterase/lipase family protein [Corynebacterium sp. 335C]